MGFIFLSCLLWWIPIMAWIPLFRLLSRPQSPHLLPDIRLALSTLLGMLAMIVLGDLSNFFIPVYPLIPCLAATVGLIAFLIHRRWLTANLSRLDILTALFVLAFASLAATRTPAHVDTGLYHLQSVRWITDRSLVPGLANLHLRLGYNSALAMVAAVMEAPGLLGRSMFLLNTLLATVAVCISLDSMRQIISDRITLSTGLLVLLLYPAIDMAIGRGTTPLWASCLPSLGNDMAAMFLIVLVLALMTRPREPDPSADLSVALVAVLLAVMAMIVKVSTAPLLAGAILLASYRILHLKAWRPAIIVATLSAITLGAWMARGIGLSGCPLYPSTLARLPVKWAVPIQDAHRDLSWIRSWARDTSTPPAETLANWNWIGPWFHKLNHDHIRLPALALLTLLGLTAAVWGAYRIRPPRIPGRAWIAIATAAVGILYWFIMAPDPRFGYGFIFSFCALSLLAGAQSLAFPLQSPLARTLIIALPLLGLFMGPSLRKQFPKNALTQIPQVPEVPVVQINTADGLAINVPTDAHRALRAPLPSSWKVSPTLRASVNAAGQPTLFWSVSSAQ